MNKTETKNTMMLLVVLTVLSCLTKFLLEGVAINIGGHSINFGHVDATVYLALLSPILGSHSFIESKKPKAPSNDKQE